MTVASATRLSGPFTGNGSVDTYDFEFKVLAGEHLLLVETDTDGVETTLALGDDYTVVLNEDQDTNPGGTVTLAADLTDDHLLTIFGDTPATQSVNLTNAGGFFPSLVNTALDKLTMIGGEAKRDATSALSKIADLQDLVDLVDALQTRIDNIDALGDILTTNRIIAPSDTATLSPRPGALYLPDGGFVALEGSTGTVTIVEFAPGDFFRDFSPTKIRATGTTAPTIWGFFP